MSGAHTPGPWVALPEEADSAYIRIRGTRLGDRYKIANVLDPLHLDLPKEAAVTRANARLIATAPEQHELLATVTEWARQVAAREDVPMRVRSAAAALHDDGKRVLAKATGSAA